VVLDASRFGPDLGADCHKAQRSDGNGFQHGITFQDLVGRSACRLARVDTDPMFSSRKGPRSAPIGFFSLCHEDAA
jgi:hypothetical protein